MSSKLLRILRLVCFALAAPCVLPVLHVPASAQQSPSAATFNASISGSTMNVQAVFTGVIAVGQTVTFSAAGAARTTVITAAPSGGGQLGNWTVSPTATAALQSMRSAASGSSYLPDTLGGAGAPPLPVLGTDVFPLVRGVNGIPTLFSLPASSLPGTNLSAMDANGDNATSAAFGAIGTIGGYGLPVPPKTLAATDLSNAAVGATTNLGLSKSATLDYGLKGDALVVSGITTTSGSATFGGVTLPTDAGGKTIIVPGANVDGSAFVSTVATTTSFADLAGASTSPSTYFAAPGQPCFPATDQSGSGSYAPGDLITLDDGGLVNAQCLVTYTEMNAATVAIVSNGSGCPFPDNSEQQFGGTTGTGGTGTLDVGMTVVGGSVTAITKVYSVGRYVANPTDINAEPVKPAPVLGSCTVNPTISFKMGVAAAQVAVPGVVPSKPADPVAQGSTSGSGTGATFTMTNIYKAAGSATYGTDNTLAFTAMMADTSNPSVYFQPGTYLVNCGSYTAASAISMHGAGNGTAGGQSTIQLFPYCAGAGNFLTYTSAHGVQWTDIAFDDNFAYATHYLRPLDIFLFQRGSNATVMDRVAFLNFPVHWNIVQYNASIGGTPAPIERGWIRDAFFQTVNPDITPANALTMSPDSPGLAAISRFVVSGNILVGSDTQLGLANSVISDNECSGVGYGGCFFDGIGDNADIHDDTWANNHAHDTFWDVDINNTSPKGFELHGARPIVIGNKSEMNGGAGFGDEADHSRWLANVARNNCNSPRYRAGDGTDCQSGFLGLGGLSPDNGSYAEFQSNSAYDDRGSSATQVIGYNEVGNHPLIGMRFGPNAFTGATQAVAFSTIAGSTHVYMQGGALSLPSGRVTLINGSPVMPSSCPGAGCPDGGSKLYYNANGALTVPRTIGGYWNIPGSASSGVIVAGLSTAHVTAGNLYDIYMVDDGTGTDTGTLCTVQWSGPATPITRSSVLGFWTNLNTINDCWGGADGNTDYGPIGPSLGTDLASFYATADGTTSVIVGRAAANSGAGSCVCLSNFYNQIPITSGVTDTNASFTVTSTSWEPLDSAHTGTFNRAAWIDPLAAISTTGTLIAALQTNTSGTPVSIGIMRDGVSPPGVSAPYGATTIGSVSAQSTGQVLGKGYHYLQAAEQVGAGATGTITGLPSEALILQTMY